MVAAIYLIAASHWELHQTLSESLIFFQDRTWTKSKIVLCGLIEWMKHSVELPAVILEPRLLIPCSQMTLCRQEEWKDCSI